MGVIDIKFMNLKVFLHASEPIRREALKAGK